MAIVNVTTHGVLAIIFVPLACYRAVHAEVSDVKDAAMLFVCGCLLCAAASSCWLLVPGLLAATWGISSVYGLALMAEKGDERAIEALCGHLEYGQDYVRDAAVRALAQVADKGNERAIIGLCACLRDVSGCRRCAAVTAGCNWLGVVGDAVAIIICRKKKKGKSFGQNVLSALVCVAEKGDQQALGSVCACLEDTPDDVRQAGLQALELLAGKAGERAINAVCARLKDVSAHVRQAAVQVLPQFGEKGDEWAIEAVCACLLDENVMVRRAALQVLPRVAEKGDECAIEAVCARLLDRAAYVRRAAVQVLPQLAEKGNEWTIEAVCARLEHANGLVSDCPMQALAQVAEKGDAWAIEAVCAALAQVAEMGDEFAIKTVCARLKHADESVRDAALLAVAQMLEPLSIESTLLALESNSSLGVKLKSDALGESLERFAFALQQNTSVLALDLTFTYLSQSDAKCIVAALGSNTTVIALKKQEHSNLDHYGEDIAAILARNRGGLQVLTLAFHQPHRLDNVVITCTSIAGHDVATVELSVADDLLTLDKEIAKQSQHPGLRSFVLADGSLIGCASTSPTVQVSELLRWTGVNLTTNTHSPS